MATQCNDIAIHVGLRSGSHAGRGVLATKPGDGSGLAGVQFYGLQACLSAHGGHVHLLYKTLDKPISSKFVYNGKHCCVQRYYRFALPNYRFN